MDAFDADVLIYAVIDGHPLGRRVRALFHDEPLAQSGAIAGVGSVLLSPEVLIKPARADAVDELDALSLLLGQLELRPTDEATAQLATALGAKYGLPTVDAVHLATAIVAGADRFITNNASDFPQTITEIDVVYPLDLPDPEP